MSFWDTLPRPFVALAPLADVTDPAFRRIIAHHSAHLRGNGTVGGPDVMWTEFVSADGLSCATPDGKRKLLADLRYTEAERPIVAQLFSSIPAHMEASARLCRTLGFDGVDINMGCPDRSVERQGCGAALIQNPACARRIIRAAQKGAGSKHGGIPVSVKTRLGYAKDELETWLPELLAEAPAAVTLHTRTRQELSRVPARFERVKAAVSIRDKVCNTAWQERHRCTPTLIIGNGDVQSCADGRRKALQTGADGVMLGRAVFGNPWLFHPVCTPEYVPPAKRLAVMCEHARLFGELLPHKNFAVMKKHFKAYVAGFENAPELRRALAATQSFQDVEAIIAAFLRRHPATPVY